MKSLNLFICLLFVVHTLSAKVKPNTLFSDHVVFQQGVYTPIWGTAADGEKITVIFNGQQVSTTTQDGKWMVQLDPMDYLTTPSKMKIIGEDTVTISDILVGEVWICSGQSNMERQLGPRGGQPLIHNWVNERDSANYPLIREYFVPHRYAREKQTEAGSHWEVCSPKTVSEFSAIGFFFARNLHTHLNVPIGILFPAYGGTIIEDWTSREAFDNEPQLIDFMNHYDSITSKEWHPGGEVMNGLYNGMIHPLIPYGIKGVVWYQGENNVSRSETYRMALSNMIRNWRDDFGQGDFPFLIVQVAPYRDLTPELREAQFQAARYVKNTALTVITDLGLADQIHPPLKQPIGERLSYAARALAYGEKVEYSGPTFHSFKIKGNKIVLRFTHTGKGLTAKDGSLKGFTIADSSKLFMPATALIKRKTIEVYSPNIDKPIAVRYGWENVPDVNLFNKNGFPASPFRTDE